MTDKSHAVVLMGAGAALHLGAPSTRILTERVEAFVQAADYAGETALQDAYHAIKATLQTHLRHADDVNFEHIYHVTHELLKRRPPTAGAMNEFRPLLAPFFAATLALDEQLLRRLAETITDALFACLTEVSDKRPDTSTLATFIAGLRATHVARMYTTNYDDLVLQAAPDLYTGFVPDATHPTKRFDLDGFAAQANADAIFHLHGSVHFGFPHPTQAIDIGEIRWFDDPTEAQRYQNSGTKSIDRTMDGMSVLRSAVVTGLDKLTSLQAVPLVHFYQAFAHDVMRADVIYVIGSGLSDLHLNTWLAEARARAVPPSLIFVDFWPHGFDYLEFGPFTNKDIELFHRLKVHSNDRIRPTQPMEGWTVTQDRTAAVWDRGFKDFLDQPQALTVILASLCPR